MARKRKNPVANMRIDMSSVLTDSVLMLSLHSHIKPALVEVKKDMKEFCKREIPIAIEFGFRCAEKGWNLERTMQEYQSLITKKGELTNG